MVKILCMLLYFVKMMNDNIQYDICRWRNRGVSYAKRFNVTGITRDKEYDLTKGDEKSKVHYFSVNPNGEAEVVRIILSPNCSARKKEFEFYFEEMEIKGTRQHGQTGYKISNKYGEV